MFLLSAALGSVTVDDPTRCVDRERLENELSFLLGNRVDDLGVAVFVTGDGDLRRTRTEVRERRAIIWTGRLEVAVDDCQALPDALGLTVKSGLGALPGWSWDRPRRPPAGRWTLEIRTLGTLPSTADFSLGGGPDLRLWGPLGVWTHARLSTSLPVRVGIGRATQSGASLAGGVQVTTGQARVWTGIGGGPVWAIGQGYADNLITQLSRLELEAGLGAQLGASGWLAVQAAVPIVRRTLSAPGGSTTEGALYLGLSIGIRVGSEKRTPRSDAGRALRASLDR